MQETDIKQKRMTLKTLHEMLDGMSVELAEKVHLLFMVFILSSKKETKKVLSFLLAQMKELKKTSTPNKLPPILGSLIDYEGRPSSSKF